MSEMKNGEQPAFGFGYANHLSYHQENGLTKREYFAAMAMQALIPMQRIKDDADYIARIATLQADALLKALEE